MSTAKLGADRKLLVGTTAAAKVDITQVGGGTGEISRSRTYDSRPRPGARGRGGMQIGRFFSDALTFPTDSDATTDPIFRAAAAQRLYYTLQEQGEATGLPQEVGECVVSSWQMTFDRASDSVVYDGLTLDYDGSPTITTQ